MPSSAHLYMALSDADDSGKATAPIPGEIVVPSYLGQIELSEWDWELNRRSSEELNVDPHLLTEPSELSFGKPMDLASPLMLDRLRTGGLLKAVITVTEDAQEPFKLVVTIEKGRLTSYDLNASDGEKVTEVKEKWKMNYEKITLEHVPDRRPGQTALKTVSTVHQRSPYAKSSASNPAQKVIKEFADLKSAPERREAFGGIEIENKKPIS